LAHSSCTILISGKLIDDKLIGHGKDGGFAKEDRTDRLDRPGPVSLLSPSGRFIVFLDAKTVLALKEISTNSDALDFSVIWSMGLKVLDVSFSLTDRFFTVLLDDFRSFVWDLESQQLVSPPLTKEIEDFGFHDENPTNEVLQSSHESQLEVVFSQTSINEISAQSANGQMVARWGPQTPMTLCDAATGESIIDFHHHIPDQAVVTLAGFTSNDRSFTAVLEDGRTYVWDLLTKGLMTSHLSNDDGPHREQQQQDDLDIPVSRKSHTSLVLPPDFVYSVRSSSGVLIARWGREEPLSISDAENGHTIVDASRHIALGGVRSAGFSSDDQFFTAVLIDFASFTWDLKTGQLLSSSEPSALRGRSDKACCNVM
jgi:WD40 repeat protein